MDKGLPAWLWGLIIVAIVIVVGFFDWLTGYELDFLLFYFLPITLGAWFLGLGASLTLAFVCAIVWAGADVLSGHEYPSYLYVVWNSLIRFVSFIAIGWSVYKIRNLLDRVRERTVELEFANRELEAFSYSVSHDLKGPLRAIEGFCRMLVTKHSAKLDTEGIRLLNVVCTNSKRMDHLINDLLAFSRLGQQQISKSVIDLSVLAKQVFQQFLDQAPERDLQLIVNDLPPALADPNLLSQVMVNLLANAVKYTRPKKTAVIEVGGHTEGSEIVYYIKDNGIGFDKHYAHKIFETFERLHSADEYEGTGIGLSIVKRIIERHGGRVWAESELGRGSTFYFSIPV
jgi:light-regulated signal transduction histidine kinase (bacteriophytochrome)